LKLTVLNPKKVIFEGEAKSVFLNGDQAEFELLDHHAPMISLLRPGDVIVDWDVRIPVKTGMVRYANNECVVLTE
jgi:F-type H+-transporting ATPase subunit epsilon